MGNDELDSKQGVVRVKKTAAKVTNMDVQRFEAELPSNCEASQSHRPCKLFRSNTDRSQGDLREDRIDLAHTRETI